MRPPEGIGFVAPRGAQGTKPPDPPNALLDLLLDDVAEQVAVGVGRLLQVAHQESTLCLRHRLDQTERFLDVVFVFGCVHAEESCVALVSECSGEAGDDVRT